MANERIPDINVAAWLDQLATMYRSIGGCAGAQAVLALVALNVADTRRMLDALPADFYLTRPLDPLRGELLGLEQRVASYVSALQSTGGAQTADTLITCERVYYWLTTGTAPDDTVPIDPATGQSFLVLRMGDARLAATLWNQVSQAAVLNHQQNASIPLPFGSTPEGDYAREQLREWLSVVSRNLDEATPGEDPTALDKTKAAIEAMRQRIGALVEGVPNPANLLRYAAWAVGGIVLLYVLYKLFSDKTTLRLPSG